MGLGILPREDAEVFYSELEALGNVRLPGTALDRTLLLARDDSGVPQVVGQVGDTTDEPAMVADVFGAFHDEVRALPHKVRLRRFNCPLWGALRNTHSN